MKLKLLLTLICAGGLTAAAQGYQDGVDNYNAGRLDVAKTILVNTIDQTSGTSKAEAYYYLGMIDFKEGEIAAAKANFEKGSQADPAYPNNLIGIGKIYLMNGDKGAAEKEFKAATEIRKKDNEILANVARAYWEVDPVKYAKDIDKTIAKALKDSKNSEPAVFVLQGDMKAKENPGDAAGLYEMAIDFSKQKGKVNREAYVKFANTYFHVAPKFAIEKLEELNKLEPNSALAQRELAEKYYENDQWGSAYQTYGKYLENPNHFKKDERRYVALCVAAKEYDTAINLANKILAEDPSDYAMYRMIALSQDNKQDYAAAEAASAKLFELAKPEQLTPNDYIVYGNSLSNVGKADQAVAVFEKAIELNPDKPELLVDLSNIYEKAGQNEKAVETMKRYLDGGNGKVMDFVNMARRYDGLARSLKGDENKAAREAAAAEGVKYIDMAIEKAPNSPVVYAIKGQIILGGTENNPNAEMAQTYQKLLEVLDSDPANKEKYGSFYGAAYYMLGLYYLDTDKTKATEYLNNYLTIDPDNERVKQLIESLSAN